MGGRDRPSSIQTLESRCIWLDKAWMYGTMVRGPLPYRLYQGQALNLLVLSPLLRTSGSSPFLPKFQPEVIAHWKTTHWLLLLSMNKHSQKRPSRATGNICIYLFSISINYIFKCQFFHSPLWLELAQASLVLGSTDFCPSVSIDRYMCSEESYKPMTQMTKCLQVELMSSELNSFSLQKLAEKSHQFVFEK